MIAADQKHALAESLSVLGLDSTVPLPRRDGGERYVVVPGLCRPRWILPARSATVLRGGIAIYRPWRWTGKLARWGLLTAAALPVLCCRLFDRLDVGPEEASAWKEKLQEVYGLEDPCLAFCVGTPGPRRKTTIAVMGPQGLLVGVAKIGSEGPGADAVRHEAKMLRSLADRRLLEGQVSRVLWSGELDSMAGVCMTVAPEAVGAATLSPVHSTFLSRLATGAPLRVGDSAQYDEVRVSAGELLPDCASESRAPLEQALAILEDSFVDIRLPRVVLHGDFAPWNLRVGGEGLFALDWEYGDLEGLPLLDLLHFVVQTGFLLDRSPASQLLRRLPGILAEECARSYMEQVRLDREHVYPLLQFYLLRELVVSSRAAADAGERWVLSGLDAGKLELLRLVLKADPAALGDGASQGLGSL